MQEVALKFGDGATLPFTPCKKGYRPFQKGNQMYACDFHEKARRQRVTKADGKFRKGEVLLDLFWQDASRREKDRLDSLKKCKKKKKKLSSAAAAVSLEASQKMGTKQRIREREFRKKQKNPRALEFTD